jgi:hypothetical protein
MRLVPVIFACVLLFACNGGTPGKSDLPVFDGSTAYDYLVAQCDLGPRVPNTPAHLAASEWFAHHFDSLGFDVELQRFDLRDPYSAEILHLVNIIARLNPQANERLLFGAHWECRPRCEHDPDPAKRDEHLPGANDGASGVAVLLQLAAHLSELKIDRGIDLVLFDGEDWGKPSDLNN